MEQEPIRAWNLLIQHYLLRFIKNEILSHVHDSYIGMSYFEQITPDGAMAIGSCTLWALGMEVWEWAWPELSNAYAHVIHEKFYQDSSFQEFG